MKKGQKINLTIMIENWIDSLSLCTHDAVLAAMSIGQL